MHLVVGQPAQVPGSLLGQRGQHRAGAHRVGGPVPGEHLAAQPVRAERRGQLRQVHIGGVTQADRRGRALDFPFLGDPRPARVQVGDVRRPSPRRRPSHPPARRPATRPARRPQVPRTRRRCRSRTPPGRHPPAHPAADRWSRPAPDARAAAARRLARDRGTRSETPAPLRSDDLPCILIFKNIISSRSDNRGLREQLSSRFFLSIPRAPKTFGLKGRSLRWPGLARPQPRR